MQLQARAFQPNSTVAIVVDGSTLAALNPQDSVERLAECLTLLHQHQCGPLLRAEVRFVPRQSPPSRAAQAVPCGRAPIAKGLVHD